MFVWVIIVSVRDLNCDGYDILTELSLDVWLLVNYLLIVNILNTDDFGIWKRNCMLSKE